MKRSRFLFCVFSIGVICAICGQLLFAITERFGTGYQKFAQPQCENCPSTKLIQVHHIVTEKHIFEKLAAGEITQEEAENLANNNPTNLVSLCRHCHFVLGHKCNWQTENPHVRAQIAAGRPEGLGAPSPQPNPQENP
jgi:hypothetical protein